jgi:biotin carboxyl carrier protein
MKLRLDLPEDTCTLELTPLDSGNYRYAITGAELRNGLASVSEVMPGVYSILEDTRSWVVTLAQGPAGLEAWVGNARYVLPVNDPRDHGSQFSQPATGPVQVRSSMPGKVIRVLVERGAEVTAGQGLVVVEAMKMQNELKAPRAGRITAIGAIEGATVAAGAILIVLE